MLAYDKNLENAEITVVIVSWYSARFIARLVDNLRQKAAYSSRIQFLIVDNTNGKDQEIAALCKTLDEVNLQPIDSQGYTGSYGHAMGLDYATERISTEYALVVDPDVYVFKQDWDMFLSSELLTAGAVAIGAPYPWWKLGKYHDFPSPVFMLCKTRELQKLGATWTPFCTNPVRLFYNFVARIAVRMYRLGTRKRLEKMRLVKEVLQAIESIVGICSPDTGWHIARAARKAWVRSVLFREADAYNGFLRKFDSLPAAQTIASEYELFHYKGQPMIAHMYSTHSYHWSTPRGHDEAFWWKCVEKLEAALTQNTDTVDFSFSQKGPSNR